MSRLQPPPSIRGLVKVSAKAIANARKLWAQAGYQGS
jgi:hypothetical protein